MSKCSEYHTCIQHCHVYIYAVTMYFLADSYRQCRLDSSKGTYNVFSFMRNFKDIQVMNT